MARAGVDPDQAGDLIYLMPIDEVAYYSATVGTPT